MKHFIFTIVIIFCQFHFLFAQLIPHEYIVKMKIKKITEYSEGPLNDTNLNVLYFYKNGKFSQVIRYSSKKRYIDIGLDSNNIGSKIAFYTCYTYDNKGRKNFTASSWTSLSEPYIMTEEYFYSDDGDTTFVKRYNDKTGESHIWTDPHLNNRDSTVINKNCIAYFTTDKDTVLYKYSYHNNGVDSIIYSSDFAKYEYRYEVYRNGLLLDLGFLHRNSENNILISKYQIFFDKSGFPYKSSYYHYSSPEPFISEIKVETY
jgi:hypothetical protein